MFMPQLMSRSAVGRFCIYATYEVYENFLAVLLHHMILKLSSCTFDVLIAFHTFEKMNFLLAQIF